MAVQSIPECDAAIMRAHTRYLRAEEAGDFDAATKAYDRLDALLEIRLHLPQQRTTP